MPAFSYASGRAHDFFVLWSARHCPRFRGHREVESEQHDEKSRVVVDGGCANDDPVGQRWDKVEPALWGQRRSHLRTATRCLRTARTEEQRVSSGVAVAVLRKDT